jgi:hypothetical protein
MLKSKKDWHLNDDFLSIGSKKGINMKLILDLLIYYKKKPC